VGIKAHARAVAAIKVHAPLGVGIKALARAVVATKDHARAAVGIKAHARAVAAIKVHAPLGVGIKAHARAAAAIKARGPTTPAIKAHARAAAATRALVPRVAATRARGRAPVDTKAAGRADPVTRAHVPTPGSAAADQTRAAARAVKEVSRVIVIAARAGTPPGRLVAIGPPGATSVRTGRGPALRAARTARCGVASPAAAVGTAAGTRRLEAGRTGTGAEAEIAIAAGLPVAARGAMTTPMPPGVPDAHRLWAEAAAT
jgi:hypothetical protein